MPRALRLDDLVAANVRAARLRFGTELKARALLLWVLAVRYGASDASMLPKPDRDYGRIAPAHSPVKN